jgi:hypothetical protein
MGLAADMRSQKESAVPQRQFRVPGKKVARTEQTEEARPQEQQPDMERYWLQTDSQTKRSFKAAEAARSAAAEIKGRFPALHVAQRKSRAVWTYPQGRGLNDTAQ